jgi:hypothetical protein
MPPTSACPSRPSIREGWWSCRRRVPPELKCSASSSTPSSRILRSPCASSCTPAGSGSCPYCPTVFPFALTPYSAASLTCKPASWAWTLVNLHCCSSSRKRCSYSFRLSVLCLTSERDHTPTARKVPVRAIRRSQRRCLAITTDPNQARSVAADLRSTKENANSSRAIPAALHPLLVLRCLLHPPALISTLKSPRPHCKPI